jgi:hypothetical protein
MEQTRRTHRGSSILLKIAGLSTAFIFLAMLILAVISINSIKKVSLETAESVVRSKITGDLYSLRSMIKNQYGTLRLENGRLLNEQAQRKLWLNR